MEMCQWRFGVHEGFEGVELFLGRDEAGAAVHG